MGVNSVLENGFYGYCCLVSFMILVNKNVWVNGFMLFGLGDMWLVSFYILGCMLLISLLLVWLMLMLIIVVFGCIMLVVNRCVILIVVMMMLVCWVNVGRLWVLVWYNVIVVFFECWVSNSFSGWFIVIL